MMNVAGGGGSYSTLLESAGHVHGWGLTPKTLLACRGLRMCPTATSLDGSGLARARKLSYGVARPLASMHVALLCSALLCSALLQDSAGERLSVPDEAWLCVGSKY